MNTAKVKQPTAAELAQQRAQERHTMETGLLASMMYFGGTARGQGFLDDVFARCEAEMFINAKNKAIFSAIRQVHMQGKPVDLMAIGAALQSIDGVIATATDIAVIASSRLEALTSISALEQASRVAEEWRKDMAGIETHNALRVLQSPVMPAERALDSLKKAQSILEDTLDEENTGINACLDEYAEYLNNPSEAEKPVKMPLVCMNRILRGGIVPGELAILAARPSVGKTALALNIGYSVSCHGYGVALFSLEMTRKQLTERLIANVGNVNMSGFRQGLDERDRVKSRQAMEKMRDKPLAIIDTPKMTIAEMRRRIRQAKAKHGLKLAVVDYLQLMEPDDPRVPREQQVAIMSRDMKLMAKEFNIAILLLAQLNRKSEESNREPILSDLRESGSIEQDADIVMFLHQSRRRTFALDEPVKLIIAKGRSSGVGSEYINFLRLYQRFEESSQLDYDKAVQDDNPPHYTEAHELTLE